LPVTVDQAQGVCVKRVGVLVVQGPEQVGVVVADGGLLAVAAAGRTPEDTRRRPDRFTDLEVFTCGSRRGRRLLNQPF
jgi:hypothetical protein